MHAKLLMQHLDNSLQESTMDRLRKLRLAVNAGLMQVIFECSLVVLKKKEPINSGAPRWCNLENLSKAMHGIMMQPR